MACRQQLPFLHLLTPRDSYAWTVCLDVTSMESKAKWYHKQGTKHLCVALRRWAKCFVSC